MLIKINDGVIVNLELGYSRYVEIFGISQWCSHENWCNSVKNHHF